MLDMTRSFAGTATLPVAAFQRQPPPVARVAAWVTAG